MRECGKPRCCRGLRLLGHDIFHGCGSISMGNEAFWLQRWVRRTMAWLGSSAARCWLHGQLLGWLQDQRAQGSSTISRLPHVFWLHRLERHSFTLEQQLHGSVKNAATGLLGGSSPWLCGGSCWRGCGSRQRAVVAFYVPAFSSLCSHCFCFFARQTLTLPFASASSSWTSLSSTTCPLSS